MTPEVPTILQLSLQRMMTLGEHGAAFAAGQMGLIGMMITLSAKEYERGADIRFTENNELRALFAELAPAIGDSELKAQMEAAAKGKDESLRISALNANNYELRRLLTRVQIHAEDHGAHAAERRIWAVLKAMAARRLVQLGP